jgi:hypothetical protein
VDSKKNIKFGVLIDFDMEIRLSGLDRLFLLEITEISEFIITSGSVSLSDHASPITSGVPTPLCWSPAP